MVLRHASRPAIDHMDILLERGGFTMRPRTLLLLVIAAVAGAAVVVLPALAAGASEAKLEVNENCVEANWPCWATSGSGPKPNPASRVTIAAGGEVMFTDNASTAANIAWSGAAPTCSSGVPVSPASPATGWEGKCKFEQPGTYKFESSTLFNDGADNYTKYEVVVEAASTGTGTGTTMTSTTTTPTTTTTGPSMMPGEPVLGSPLEGGSKALKLAGSQHGSTVRGSIKVAPAGSGGRLEVGVFAASASLAESGHRSQTRVGRLVRSSLRAGSLSFQVPLSAKAKSALRRHRRLALSVKITLTPPHGAAVTVARTVVAHS
jgi:hypothetical protein